MHRVLCHCFVDLEFQEAMKKGKVTDNPRAASLAPALFSNTQRWEGRRQYGLVVSFGSNFGSLILNSLF